MLQSLRVKNLAIAEDVSVDLNGGLNVVTGETGAGKSILVGALGLVLGERADKTMIRAGEKQCSVEAVFAIADSSEINNILSELGIDACEDGQLVIRRTFANSGSGKNIVNDSPTSLKALKSLGDLLVDMHGPHDHQSLLNKDFQLDLLDSFGKLFKQRDAYRGVYDRLTALRRQRDDLDCDDERVLEQIDMLAYRIKEIEEAELKENEEAELKQEHETAANIQEIIQAANQLQQCLVEDDASAFNSMVTAQNCISSISSIVKEAQDWRTEAESIIVQVQELAKSISSYADNIETSPEHLTFLEDRLALIHKLKRKYGNTVEDILKVLAQSKEKLENLEKRGEKIAELEVEIAQAGKELQHKGSALSKERQKTGDKLAQAITNQLKDLGFGHASVNIALEPGEPMPTGLDEIEFGFAPNVGEPMRPLRAIASSGEISRVMLACKTALADHDRIPVLVFDEIDSNVGGKTGSAIGERLAAVAGKHQVICITHLPQVAVYGTTHLVVTKEVEHKRTRTTISEVAEKKRVEEIARMLGGKELTSVTLKHAEEMLKG